MAATYFVEPGPAPHPLGKGASPDAIRSALTPEDRPAFDTAYERALSEARTSLDLTVLFTTLERWRGIAVLQSDPEVFRRVARRTAETLTGQKCPEDEPMAIIRSKAGLQVYELNDDDVADQLTSLPPGAVAAYAEVRTSLEVAPCASGSAGASNPDGELRFLSFANAHGSGFVYYVNLERRRRVDIVRI